MGMESGVTQKDVEKLRAEEEALSERTEALRTAYEGKSSSDIKVDLEATYVSIVRETEADDRADLMLRADALADLMRERENEELLGQLAYGGTNTFSDPNHPVEA